VLLNIKIVSKYENASGTSMDKSTLDESTSGRTGHNKRSFDARLK